MKHPELNSLLTYNLYQMSKKVLWLNLVIIFSFITFAYYYHFSFSDKTYALVEEGKIELLLTEADVADFKNKKVIYQDQPLEFEILAVSEIEIDQNWQQYRWLTLKTELEETKLIELTIVHQPTTIMFELQKYIKENLQ